MWDGADKIGGYGDGRGVDLVDVGRAEDGGEIFAVGADGEVFGPGSQRESVDCVDGEGEVSPWSGEGRFLCLGRG